MVAIVVIASGDTMDSQRQSMSTEHIQNSDVPTDTAVVDILAVHVCVYVCLQ